MKTLYNYKNCKLVEDDKLRFFYPDGDQEFVRSLTSIGDTDTTYYQIGNKIDTNLKQLFNTHVEESV